MRTFKLPRTPHGNNTAHFWKVFGFFLLSTAIVSLFGLGVSFTGSTLAMILVIPAIALSTIISGIFSTLIIRTIFNLHQTGKFIQYASFWIMAMLSLLLNSAIFAETLVLTNTVVAGFLIFALAFLPATVTGVIPFKTRRWLPVHKKTRG